MNQIDHLSFYLKRTFMWS